MPVASPRRNRVTPIGDIEALALRGAWTGNRGILHSDNGDIVRSHAHSHWLTCTLQFKGLRREQWLPQCPAAPSAQALDRRLHAERIVRGTHRRQMHSVTVSRARRPSRAGARPRAAARPAAA